jgi:hypothetical protein
MTHVDMADRLMLWRCALDQSMEEIYNKAKGKPSKGNKPINLADYRFTNQEVETLKQFVTIGKFAKAVLTL